MKDSGIVISNELFPAKACDDIIEVYEDTIKTCPSYVHQSVWGPDKEASSDQLMIRNDSFLCLDEIAGWNKPKMNLPRQVNDYLNKALRVYYKHYPILDRPRPDVGLYSIRQKLQKTPISGGYHLWHYENSGIQVFHRVLAWTIYLNDVKEGGETEFLYQSERIKPVKGLTCFFPAGFMHTHRGNPPISNDKYILTGWYSLYEPIPVV